MDLVDDDSTGLIVWLDGVAFFRDCVLSREREGERVYICEWRSMSMLDEWLDGWLKFFFQGGRVRISLPSPRRVFIVVVNIL